MFPESVVLFLGSLDSTVSFRPSRLGCFSKAFEAVRSPVFIFLFGGRSRFLVCHFVSSVAHAPFLEASCSQFEGPAYVWCLLATVNLEDSRHPFFLFTNPFFFDVPLLSDIGLCLVHPGTSLRIGRPHFRQLFPTCWLELVVFSCGRRARLVPPPPPFEDSTPPPPWVTGPFPVWPLLYSGVQTDLLSPAFPATFDFYLSLLPPVFSPVLSLATHGLPGFLHLPLCCAVAVYLLCYAARL